MTVIQEAVDHIHKHTPDFDIYEISLEDGATFEMLNAGETMGVFQLESGGNGGDLSEVWNKSD